MRILGWMLLLISQAFGFSQAFGLSQAYAWEPARPSVETLKSGQEVHWYRKLGYPLAEMGWTLEAGSAQDPKGKSGLSEMICMLLARKLSVQIQSTGSSAYCQADADDISIRIEGFASGTTELLSALVSVMGKPEWTAAEVEWVRQQKQEAVLHRADQPDALASILLHRLLWKNTPYAAAYEGLMEDIRSVTVSDIQAWYAEFGGVNRTRLWILSPVDAVLLRPLLEKAPPASVKSIPALSFPNAVPPPAVQVIHRPGLSQAWFQFGLRVDGHDRAALSVLNAIVGDTFQSRLTSELRDEKGVVYSIGSRLAHLKSGSQILIEGTAPMSLAGLVQVEVLRILRSLDERLPTEAEIASARTYLLGKYILGFAAPSAIAEYYISEKQVGDLGQSFEKVGVLQTTALLNSQFKKKTWLSIWVGDADVISKSLQSKGQKSVTRWSPQEILFGKSLQKSPQKKSQSSAKSVHQKPGP